MYGLYKAGAMEEINCTFVQLLVFSSLIVAVDPVAVRTIYKYTCSFDNSYTRKNLLNAKIQTFTPQKQPHFYCFMYLLDRKFSNNCYTTQVLTGNNSKLQYTLTGPVFSPQSRTASYQRRYKWYQ